MFSKLLRAMGLLAGLSICLFFTVTLPVLLAYVVWLGSAKACHLALSFLSAHADLWRWAPDQALLTCSASAPQIKLVAMITVALFVAAYALLLIAHAVIPMRARLKGLFQAPKALPPSHPLHEFLNSRLIAGKGPRARIWVTPTGGVSGYAVSGPFHGNAIVLSRFVVEEMHPAVAHWILAHEYGHIQLGHTHTATLWLIGIRAINRLGWLRRRLASALLRVTATLPIVRIFASPLWLVLWLLERVASPGCRVGVAAFLLMDRWASRRMELEADAYAASVCGCDPGIWLFNQLEGAFEPRFNSLFATHPSHRSRADKLEKMKSVEVTRA